MKVSLTQELINLDSKQAALTLAAARTKRIVGQVAQDSLGDVENDVSDLLLRCNAGQIDITWQAKMGLIEDVNSILAKKRKALQAHDQEEKYLMSGAEPTPK